MVPTQPSRNRLRVRREIGGLTIVIAARRHWGLVLFLGFWLCGWLMGETFALKMLVSGRAGLVGSLFLLVWLAMWTLGGVAAWVAFLGALTGEETIVLGPDAVSIRRSVLGVGRTRLVATRTLRNLRTTQATVGWVRASGKRGHLERGRIAVDADGETVRFGADLDEREAEYLISVIRSEIDIRAEPAPPARGAIALPA